VRQVHAQARRPERVVAVVLAILAGLLVVRWWSSATLPGAAPPPPAVQTGPHTGRLVVSGLNPVVLDLASGLAQRLPGGFDDPPQLALALPEGTIWITRWDAWVIVTAPGATPRRLGRAYGVLPSLTPGRVWLVWAATSTDAHYELTEVALADGRTTARLDLPVWTPPMAFTRAGIVARDMVARTLVLLDPAGRRRLRVFGSDVDFIDAQADLVAWIDDAGLHLLDLAGGRDAPTRLVKAPDDLAWLRIGPLGFTGCCSRIGRFGPGGRTLAVFAEMRRPGDPGLALVDVAGATARAVAGSRDAIPFNCLNCVGWSPAGDWVFWLSTTPGQVGAAAVGRGGPAIDLAVDSQALIDSAPNGIAGA
jgi:hypothetical protein